MAKRVTFLYIWSVRISPRWDTVCRWDTVSVRLWDTVRHCVGETVRHCETLCRWDCETLWDTVSVRLWDTVRHCVGETVRHCETLCRWDCETLWDTVSVRHCVSVRISPRWDCVSCSQYALRTIFFFFKIWNGNFSKKTFLLLSNKY